ncbi:MAG TPA: hypothetical protein VK074_06400 [Fodinibius sp.]|nr:hypothetical protein [Fodinibius sp.]
MKNLLREQERKRGWRQSQLPETILLAGETAVMEGMAMESV